MLPLVTSSQLGGFPQRGYKGQRSIVETRRKKKSKEEEERRKEEERTVGRRGYLAKATSSSVRRILVFIGVGLLASAVRKWIGFIFLVIFSKILSKVPATAGDVTGCVRLPKQRAALAARGHGCAAGGRDRSSPARQRSALGVRLPHGADGEANQADAKKFPIHLLHYPFR